MVNFPYQPNSVDETISLSEKEKLHHVKQAFLLCLSPLYSFPNKNIITTVQYKYLPYCLRGVGVSGFLRIAVCNERQQRGRCVSVMTHLYGLASSHLTFQSLVLTSAHVQKYVVSERKISVKYLGQFP